MDYERLFEININIADKITKISYAGGRQNYDGVIRTFQSLLPDIQELMTMLLTEVKELEKADIMIDSAYLMGILSDLMQAQEQRDYILLADLLELSLRPFIQQLQEKIRAVPGGTPWREYFQENIQVLEARDSGLAQQIKKAYAGLRRLPGSSLQYRTEDGTIYSLEDTQNGCPVLHIARSSRSYYLHSNQDAGLEAMRFAESYADCEAEEYHILGAGLFYHVFGLAEKTYGLSPLHVYEPDCSVLALACTVCNLSAALNQYLFLHYDPRLTTLAGAAGQHPCGFVIHAPSLWNIKELEIRRSFEKFFIANASYRNQEQLLKINFRKNTAYLTSEDSGVYPVDSILSLFREKEVFIVAAGPSLDTNIEALRGRGKGTVLLAVGTVFHKLMGMGIRPDYLIITDPNERVLWQLREHEGEKIPMLLLSTACYGFIERYAGKKYLVMQKDFEPSEKLASKKGYRLFATGGSVATTALDVMLRAGVSKLIFLGLDLAFTDNLAHAEGTSGRLATEEEDLIPVKAFGGGTVLADFKFIMYREWMEKRLREADAGGIRVINATEGGCFIEGMQHIPLQAAIESGRQTVH